MQAISTTNLFYDYPRAALRCMKLAADAYSQGRTDMDSRDQGEISTVYGLPWESLGVELQGEFYSWWFVGLGKAEK